MKRFLLPAVLLIVSLPAARPQTPPQPIPKIWDEKAFAGWQRRVAGQKFAAGHFTEREYYGSPLDNLRSYPVYFPGREPEGYWEFLQKVGPQPLIAPEKLKTPQDWIDAGRRVFEELDFASSRRYDPERIGKMRSKEYLAARKVEPLPDGTIAYYRWVPTGKGVALSFSECAGCHLRWIPGPVAGGKPYHGPPSDMPFPNVDFHMAPFGAGSYLPQGDTEIMMRWRSHAVPWIDNDIHARLKTLSEEDWDRWDSVSNGPGMQARWDGSIFYPTKIPDLIGIQDRKYFDHTATHRHRSVEDLARYGAQVASADSPHFGRYALLPANDRRVPYNYSDEMLYALGLYLYSLKPPPNPHPFDAQAAAGKKLFEASWATCHTPPLYTNNKLTLAKGFTPPPEDRQDPDIMMLSVGTDPGDALLTRKGTGYYKVPSLQGVWYRGRFLHDGSLASLEEMFDPARLEPGFEPRGWNPPGVKKRAVPGHEFGLTLSPEQRSQLIAFLRTL